MNQVVYIKNKLPESPKDALRSRNAPKKSRNRKMFEYLAVPRSYMSMTLYQKILTGTTLEIMLKNNEKGVYSVERLTDQKLTYRVHLTFYEKCFPKLEHSASSSSSNEAFELTRTIFPKAI